VANLRALIIDDQAVVRNALRRLLTAAGVETVAEAHNLPDAIHKARKFNPDIVILDATLPDSPGLTPLQAFAEIMPQTPILYLGADPDTLYADQALQAGATYYIAKEDLDSQLSPFLSQLEQANSGDSRSTLGRNDRRAQQDTLRIRPIANHS